MDRHAIERSADREIGAIPGNAGALYGTGPSPPVHGGRVSGCRPHQPGAAQFTNVPMTRAMVCAISLSSGNDSMPITEYPSSHGIR